MSGWVTRVVRTIPARTSLLMGWLLLVVAAARSQQHDTDLQLAYLASGLVVLPVLVACIPIRKPDPKSRRPVIAQVAALTVAALGALILIAGTVQIVNWREQLWAVPGVLWAVSSGLALFAGGAVRWSRLSSREWPKGDASMLVRPSAWGRRKQLGVVATVAVSIALPSAVVASTVWRQVDASTADEVKAQAVPGRINSVAWRTTLAARPKAVYPGSVGPIVAMDGGVRAYDGNTGKEIWHYLRRGPGAVNSAVTPDHQHVVVVTYTEHGWSNVWTTTRYTLISSTTGAVTNEFDVSSKYLDARPLVVNQPDLLVGNQVVVTQIGGTLTGFSLTTGQRQWERPLSAPDCYPQNWAIAQDVLLQSDHCFTGEPPSPATESYGLQGILLQNGRSVWKQSIEAKNTARIAVPPQLTVSPDGMTLVFGATIRNKANGTTLASAHWLLQPFDGKSLVKGGLTWNQATMPVPVDGMTWMQAGAPPVPGYPDGDYIQLQAPRKKEVYRPSSIETPDYLTSEEVRPADRGWVKLSDQLAIVGSYRSTDSRSPELEANPELPTVRSVWLRAVLGDLPAQILPGAHGPGSGVSDQAIMLTSDLGWQVTPAQQLNGASSQFLIPAPGAVVALLARGDSAGTSSRTSAATSRASWQLIGMHWMAP